MRKKGACRPLCDSQTAVDFPRRWAPPCPWSTSRIRRVCNCCFHILMPFWVGRRATTRFFLPISCYFYGPPPNRIDWKWSRWCRVVPGGAPWCAVWAGCRLKEVKIITRQLSWSLIYVRFCWRLSWLTALVISYFFWFSFFLKLPVGQEANLCGCWYLLAVFRALASIVYAIWAVDYASH